MLCKQGVTGSIPVTSTKNPYKMHVLKMRAGQPHFILPWFYRRLTYGAAGNLFKSTSPRSHLLLLPRFHDFVLFGLQF